MEINTNLNLGGVNGLSNTQPPAPGSKPAPGSEILSDSSELQDALGNAPDIRPDVVANARALVNSDGYPPADTIKSLANFLAGKLTGQK